MAYWRMQLHPNDPSKAVYHSSKSLAAGFIGLDFTGPDDFTDQPGDLTRIATKSAMETRLDYWDFCHTMAKEDWVLVMAHNYPFALVRVSGDYNYVRTQVNPLLWFRHFREIGEIHYYADFVLNPKDWEEIAMPDTISILMNPNGTSYRLIERWVNSL